MVTMNFRHIQRIHAFHADTLAYRAGVSETLVTAMLRDQPVRQEEATKVLRALSIQYNRHYTLANVEVKVIDVLQY